MVEKSSIKILVIAPQFPSINQPWIDTYLEQLLCAGFELAIYSVLAEPQKYSPKVDALGLRDKVIRFSLSRISLIKSAAAIFCRGLDGGLNSSLWASSQLGFGVRGVVSSFFSGIHFWRFPIADFQVIHSHDEVLAYRFLHLALIRKIPIVLTFHGLPPVGVRQLSSKKRGALYRLVAKVIVNTEFAKRQVCSLGCAPEKVMILPQGLPVREFEFLPRLAPSSADPIKLLTVGRYHRDKGQAYALIALKRLLLKGINVTWSYVGVGPDLDRLKQLAKKLGVEQSVRFFVALPPEELKRLYHESHIFVLPSVNNPGGHVETQGVVLQEAQASGCIPIASNVGGIPECVNDGSDALLFKPKNSRDLANKIEYMCAHPERWQAFQEAGRRNVETNLSAEVIGQKMAALLKDVAATSELLRAV